MKEKHTQQPKGIRNFEYEKQKSFFFDERMKT